MISASETDNPASRPPSSAPARTLAALAATALALVAAFVLAPGPLAAATGPRGDFGSQQALGNAFGKAFVGYWNSGDPHFPAGLQSIVDYWFRYHVVKAAAASALLAVLIAISVLLRRSAGALVAILAIVAAALAMANIQGALAPFSSLLPMLPTGAPRGDLATAVVQIREHLAHYPNQGGPPAPAVKVMVDDFGVYHAVVAVATSLIAVVLITLSVLSWKRRAQRGMIWFGIVFTLSAIAVLVVAAANIATTADPAPALLAFFQGSW
ncbi:hypothetical protein KGQ19_43025 [Catenulispora sp. NL8]|uniref:Integral membrane protein n=1 Tax=Catenulispora pinistramenti TaxID=2705254 RepID=A0ABS5L5M4_9ACTN|nr:hypothetical protein [Catenulispora pinistramenti]MBS2553647.1 hypothetical protein [Catenulispora pinistramenti]